MLNERKIADNDIVAQDIRSQPEYDDVPNTPRNRSKLIGYSVVRSFAVTARDIPNFPKLVDELVATPGVEFSRVEIALSEASKIEDELWDKAQSDARQRAEKTLRSMGMKIDAVFAVSPVSIPEVESKITGSYGRVVVTGSAPLTAEQRGPSEYRLAPVTVNQSVHVIYLISPAK